MVFWFSINDDLFGYIFMSQPESNDSTRFFVNLIKNERGSFFSMKGCPNPNRSIGCPFWFIPILPIFVYFSPFERGAVFIRHSNELPPSCCNSPWGLFPYSLILNPFPLDFKASYLYSFNRLVTWELSICTRSWKMDQFKKRVHLEMDQFFDHLTQVKQSLCCSSTFVIRVENLEWGLK